ncbi:MAG TPA: peptidylprolyl isomerase [Sulfurimonas sp. UBA12504]|nr:MAG: peptidylprolyl isomerase [Sulfurimonas sp. GWF2_37_8]DAB30521.1 MAG TPA: peptidylprolyl isomerase [Sulfurimonas sp. UBA12504]
MKITKNILVHIHYRLSDEENNHLNPEEEELIYLHGSHGHIFDELEDALEGKKAGDTFKVTIPCEQAFGIYKEELIVNEPLSELPEDIFIGMELDSFDEETQETLIYVVTNIEDDFALLNANHPFAGRALTFEGTITELEELTPEGIQEILAHEHHDHHDH